MADIHKSFPPQGKEKKAHEGSQSAPPKKMKEGSRAEERSESKATEDQEIASGTD